MAWPIVFRVNARPGAFFWNETASPSNDMESVDNFDPTLGGFPKLCLLVPGNNVSLQPDCILERVLAHKTLAVNLGM